MKNIVQSIRSNHRLVAWDLLREQTGFDEGLDMRLFIREQLWDEVEKRMDLRTLTFAPSGTWIWNV